MEQRVTTTANPDAVWIVWSDLTAWPTWTETVTKVEPVDTGRATSVGATYRVTQPRLGTGVYTITDWQPGREFTWVNKRPGVTSTARHLVSPRPDGTGGSVVVATLDWTGPMAVVVRFVYGGLGKRYLATELAGLTRKAEQG